MWPAASRPDEIHQHRDRYGVELRAGPGRPVPAPPAGDAEDDIRRPNAHGCFAPARPDAISRRAVGTYWPSRNRLGPRRAPVSLSAPGLSSSGPLS
ncbi:hypothetical protein E4K10_43285 [Streptomyces sp. T1317-0309]|nr:hypothetical protein E4K10_43285 [Streptomyces sp. T1317-0309]